MPQLVQTSAYHDLLPLLRASVVLFGLVVVSFLVSYANDVPQKPWLRDVAPYALVACAPIFALDAQSSFTKRGLQRLVVVAGPSRSARVHGVWLTNRMIADLSFIPIGLGTMLLPAAGFAYAMSVFLDGGRARLGWLGLASAIPAMMLTTGTRTTLLLAVAPLAIVFGGRRRFAGRSFRLLIAVPLVVVFGLATIQGVVAVTGGDRDVLAKRFSLFSQIGEGSDQSYQDRVSQTNAAWALFRSSPVVGVGPGSEIAWSDSFGRPHLSPNVDSPVSFLTKYGALGLVALGFLVAGYIGTLRRLRARTGQRTIAAVRVDRLRSDVRRVVDARQLARGQGPCDRAYGLACARCPRGVGISPAGQLLVTRSLSAVELADGHRASTHRDLPTEERQSPGPSHIESRCVVRSAEEPHTHEPGGDPIHRRDPTLSAPVGQAVLTPQPIAVPIADVLHRVALPRRVVSVDRDDVRQAREAGPTALETHPQLTIHREVVALVQQHVLDCGATDQGCGLDHEVRPTMEPLVEGRHPQQLDELAVRRDEGRMPVDDVDLGLRPNTSTAASIARRSKYASSELSQPRISPRLRRIARLTAFACPLSGSLTH